MTWAINLSRRGRVLFLSAAALSVFGALAALPAAANGAGGGGPSAGGMPRTQGRQVDPAESFREGLEALDAGDYSKAEKKFGEVLEVAPKHPQANYYMGLAKVGRGQHKSARRYFERAVKELPNFVDAREQLALVYIETGESDKAEEQLAALKELQAKCAGGACGDQGARVDQAVATVENALAGVETEATIAIPDSQRFAHLLLKPRQEGVDRYRSAVRLINEARYEEAIADLYESQAIVGPHPDILNYLGYSHRKLGLFDKAQDYYAQALKLDPEHRGATEYLGELYLEVGEIDKARLQLARLDALCDFGCPEREDLARLIAIKEATRAAAR